MLRNFLLDTCACNVMRIRKRLVTAPWPFFSPESPRLIEKNQFLLRSPKMLLAALWQPKHQVASQIFLKNLEKKECKRETRRNPYVCFGGWINSFSVPSLKHDVWQKLIKIFSLYVFRSMGISAINLSSVLKSLVGNSKKIVFGEFSPQGRDRAFLENTSIRQTFGATISHALKPLAITRLRRSSNNIVWAFLHQGISYM